MTSKKVTMPDGKEIDFKKTGRIRKDITITGKGSNKKVHIKIYCRNKDMHEITFNAANPLFFEFVAKGIVQTVTEDIKDARDAEEVSKLVRESFARLGKGIWECRTPGAKYRGFYTALEAMRRITNTKTASPEFRVLGKEVASWGKEGLKDAKANIATFRDKFIAISKENRNTTRT